jgi:hypothetical protein
MSINRRWLAVIAVFAAVFALMIIPAIASDPKSIYFGTVLFMVVLSAGVASFVAFIFAPNVAIRVRFNFFAEVRQQNRAGGGGGLSGPIPEESGAAAPAAGWRNGR